MYSTVCQQHMTIHTDHCTHLYMIFGFMKQQLTVHLNGIEMDATIQHNCTTIKPHYKGHWNIIKSQYNSSGLTIHIVLPIEPHYNGTF